MLTAWCGCASVRPASNLLQSLPQLVGVDQFVPVGHGGKSCGGVGAEAVVIVLLARLGAASLRRSSRFRDVFPQRHTRAVAIPGDEHDSRIDQGPVDRLNVVAPSDRESLIQLHPLHGRDGDASRVGQLLDGPTKIPPRHADLCTGNHYTRTFFRSLRSFYVDLAPQGATLAPEAAKFNPCPTETKRASGVISPTLPALTNNMELTHAAG
jgi:hypothetical protein